LRTWRDINQQRLRYINYGEKKVRAALRKVSKDFARAVRDIGPDAALSALSEADIRNGVQQLYVNLYTVTGVAFANTTAGKLRETMKRKAIGDIDEYTDDAQEAAWIRHMRNFAETRCALKITAVTRNIHEDIEKITRALVRENPTQGPAWIAKKLTEAMGERNEWRAMRIARTETVGASNEGAIKAARDYGIRTKKKWLVNVDDLTRDDHAAMADYPMIPTDEPFQVGDDRMDYPGDPSASAGNVINCRCAITFKPERSITDDLLSGEYDPDHADIY